jgi:hypothetical protein
MVLLRRIGTSVKKLAGAHLPLLCGPHASELVQSVFNDRRIDVFSGGEVKHLDGVFAEVHVIRDVRRRHDGV